MSKATAIMTTHIMVLVIVTMSSAPALAVTSGWIVNGTNLKGTAKVSSTAAVMKKFVFKFSGITAECTGQNVVHVGGEIESPNKGSASSIEFNGCTTVAGSKCLLSSTKISSLPVKAEVTLEGLLAVRATVTPKTGTLFTTLLFTGATCSIAEEVQSVTGQMSETEPTGRKEMAKQEVIVKGGGGIEVSGSAATVEGSALVSLSSGLPWSFL
ncbi:MAG TPA: hypothetical protein VGL57_01370 [Solirubrobacteraceae bacterium]